MKRFLERCFARDMNFLLMGCAALFLCAAQSSAHAASPSTELKKMFSKMDRQLCQSLSIANCKRQASQKKSKSKAGKSASAAKSKSRKAEPVKAKPVSRKIVDDKKSTQPKPLPVLKKNKLEEAPIAPPPEKVSVPTPTLKPATLTKEATLPTVPTPVEKKAPPQKLPETKVVILPSPVLPPPQPTPPQPMPPLANAMPDGTPVGEACFDSLEKLGVKFTQLTIDVGTGMCSVSDAVQVHAMTIGNDILKLSDQPTLNCGFAYKFMSWLKVEASPTVTTATQKKIAALGTGPGFQCRGRNGDMSAKLSEHAFGNAVDIERIKLADGEIIDVKDAITSGAKFQPVLAALRATACQYFTTVLGPGTNSAHATHFHFDLARRGKKGNHKMCQ